jgi:hypothetical protein
VSNIDQRLPELGVHDGAITAPDHGSYPVTESFALPPIEGVNHVSNPLSYAALSDVPQGNEAYAREGNGRAQASLHRLRSTRSNEIA